jgi:hypothetical protein
MTDLTDLKTPFGLLDRETQEALKAHGGPLQFLNLHGKWQTSDVMDWYANSTYRVRPAPPKPREWWLVEWGDADGGRSALKDTEDEAQHDAKSLQSCGWAQVSISHVREVLPE